MSRGVAGERVLAMPMTTMPATRNAAATDTAGTQRHIAQRGIFCRRAHHYSGRVGWPAPYERKEGLWATSQRCPSGSAK
jgi:hypothetical protein